LGEFVHLVKTISELVKGVFSGIEFCEFVIAHLRWAFGGSIKQVLQDVGVETLTHRPLPLRQVARSRAQRLIMVISTGPRSRIRCGTPRPTGRRAAGRVVGCARRRANAGRAATWAAVRGM